MSVNWCTGWLHARVGKIVKDKKEEFWKELTHLLLLHN
jgi:hypothetical protein